MISKWDVYYIKNFAYALPKPKNKFVVVVHLDPIPHVFLINTDVNKFIKNKPYLMDCEAPVKANEHPFLSHDSVIDCRDIFPLTQEELTDKRGKLSVTAQNVVLNAVKICPVLGRREKRKILEL